MPHETITYFKKLDLQTLSKTNDRCRELDELIEQKKTEKASVVKNYDSEIKEMSAELKELVNQKYYGIQHEAEVMVTICLLYTSPSPRDRG